MADDDPLCPVNPKDLARTIAFALSHRAGRTSHRNDAMAYRIAGEAIAEQFRLSGLVVMQKPQRVAGPAIPTHPRRDE